MNNVTVVMDIIIKTLPEHFTSLNLRTTEVILFSFHNTLSKYFSITRMTWPITRLY